MDSVKTDAKWKLVPVEPTPEMIEAGDVANPTAWNEDTDLGFGCDVAFEVYRAMLAASPAAPGAEVEPVAWEWETFTGGCWERQSSRAKPDLERWIEPTRNLRPLYLSPPTTDAIRAQARREALEAAASLVKQFSPGGDQFDWGRDANSMREAIYDALTALAGKGEAE